MSEIRIPFREDMKRAILENRKTMTSRFMQYGRTGDYFFICGRKFVLVLVEWRSLGEVITRFWQDEGFASPVEFLSVWKEIHPKRYGERESVCIHKFEEEI